MALSAFDDKSQEPQREELTTVLAGAVIPWDAIIGEMKERFGPLSEDWVFSGKKWGWALRLKHKKRAILYMTPCQAFIVVGFALGQKALDAAHRAGLPEAILSVIDSGQKYAEGRAVRLEIRTIEDVEGVVQVALVKMAN